MTKTDDDKLLAAFASWRTSNEELRTALTPYHQTSHDLANLGLVLRMTQESAEDTIQKHLCSGPS